MKKIAGTVFFSVCLLIIYTTSNAANFKSALVKAKTESKYLLVVYGKYMQGNNHENDPLASITSETFYTKNYVIAHYNRESNEGKEFGIIFNVGSYPALYFFNPAGKLLYMDFGAKTPEELVKLGTTAMTLNTQKKSSDYTVDATYNKLQRKWYTSKAIGFYVSESIITSNNSGQLSVEFQNSKSQQELEAMIAEGLKLTPHNYYLYYLNSLLAYKQQNWVRAGRNLSAFLTAVKADDMPAEMADNTKAMLKNISTNMASLQRKD